MTRPCASTSGPPELPGLIAASVWITSPRNSSLLGLDVAVQTGDDPARHAEPAFERERVADRDDVVADLHGVGVAELDGREVGAFDLEHGEVAAGRGAEHLRRELRAVGEVRLDLRRRRRPRGCW